MNNQHYKHRCLSVIIPVYNESTTIREVIDKVLLQPSVAELIVVDDGSSDGTETIISSYANDQLTGSARKNLKCA